MAVSWAGRLFANSKRIEVIVLRRRVPLRRSVSVQRGLPPKRWTPVRQRRSRPRRGPDRSPEYLAWIRTLGCVVCSKVSGGATVIEAAHTNALGPKGLSQKTSDFSAIPLCTDHHREGQDSYHRLGEHRFVQEHQLDLPQLVAALNHLHRRQAASQPVKLLGDLVRLSSSAGIRAAPDSASQRPTTREPPTAFRIKPAQRRPNLGW